MSSAKNTLLAVGTILGLSAPAFLQEDMHSANYLMPGCRAFAGDNTPVTYRVGECMGMLRVLYVVGPYVPKNSYCMPGNATMQQMGKVIVKYIDGRPERMHESFILLATEALANAFPCIK